MKKRLMSMCLAFCLAIALAIPAYASNSAENKVQQDKDTLSSANLFTEGLKVSSVNQDDTITYSYQVTEDVTDYITLYYNSDGTVDVDIWEGNLHDVITIQTDGSVLLNGNKLKANYDEMTNVDESLFVSSISPGITPMYASTYTYSKTAFSGTAGKYTGAASTHKCANVPLAKAIRYLTGYAIGYAIATYLFPSSAADAASICGEIGVALKTKAEAEADDSGSLSYNVTSRGIPANNTFLSYRQFAGYYYTKINYGGDSVYKVYYEKRESLY